MNLEVGRQDVPLERKYGFRVDFYEVQQWENSIPLIHFYILFALIKNYNVYIYIFEKTSNEHIKISKSDLNYIKQLADLLIICCNDTDNKIRKDFSLIDRFG